MTKTPRGATLLFAGVAAGGHQPYIPPNHPPAQIAEIVKRVREPIFVGTSIWLIHNILLGSPGAVIMELLFLTTNIVGYYRFYIRRKPQ